MATSNYTTDRTWGSCNGRQFESTAVRCTGIPRCIHGFWSTQGLKANELKMNPAGMALSSRRTAQRTLSVEHLLGQVKEIVLIFHANNARVGFCLQTFVVGRRYHETGEEVWHERKLMGRSYSCSLANGKTVTAGEGSACACDWHPWARCILLSQDDTRVQWECVGAHDGRNFRYYSSWKHPKVWRDGAIACLVLSKAANTPWSTVNGFRLSRVRCGSVALVSWGMSLSESDFSNKLPNICHRFGIHAMNGTYF